jgi:acetoin utilization deacetylase AcuC-like enzyme
MLCKDKEWVSTFEEHYKTLQPMGYKRGYRDYINIILNNGCAVDMETATKHHLSLNFYKWCSKYIQKLHPKLSKGEVYEVMKGIYEEKYSGSDPIVLECTQGVQADTKVL